MLVPQIAVPVAQTSPKGMELYRVFSRDVTAAMLVSLNKREVAMLVSPTSPPGIDLYSYANAFFCLVKKHTHWSRE